jgi:hypothetical protein
VEFDMKQSRRIIVIALVVAVAVGWPRSLHAIGPTVLMFHGGTLKQPIFVTGSDTAVFPDLTRSSGIPSTEVANRRYVDVAIFWGSTNDPAVNGGTGVQGLRPEMAWQHGRFYPAAGHQAALLVATQFSKGSQPLPSDQTAFPNGGVLSDAAMAVLKRLRIPGAVPAGG